MQVRARATGRVSNVTTIKDDNTWEIEIDYKINKKPHVERYLVVVTVEQLADDSSVCSQTTSNI